MGKKQDSRKTLTSQEIDNLVRQVILKIGEYDATFTEIGEATEEILRKTLNWRDLNDVFGQYHRTVQGCE